MSLGLATIFQRNFGLILLEQNTVSIIRVRSFVDRHFCCFEDLLRRFAGVSFLLTVYRRITLPYWAQKRNSTKEEFLTYCGLLFSRVGRLLHSLVATALRHQPPNAPTTTALPVALAKSKTNIAISSATKATLK